MSVNKKHIVMIGVELDFNEYSYEDLENYIEKGIPNVKLDCIYDGMNENYIYLGKIINKGNDYYGLDMHKINLQNLIKEFNIVSNLLYYELNIKSEVKLFSFTHWY